MERRRDLLNITLRLQPSYMTWAGFELGMAFKEAGIFVPVGFVIWLRQNDFRGAAATDKVT